MARLARVVAPGIPHHIIQRGNRSQQTFFSDDDYLEYLRVMSSWCRKCEVEIWAYCLMPNHVHLIAVPTSEDGLRKAIGEAHRRYTLYINGREGWKGHLWQGRFASFPMDEVYLMATVRYILLNPVRANIVQRVEEYLWSSGTALLYGKADPLANVTPLLDISRDWQSILSQPAKINHELIRSHERTGRPLGDDSFITVLEKRLGRIIKKKKPGPKNTQN